MPELAKLWLEFSLNLEEGTVQIVLVKLHVALYLSTEWAFSFCHNTTSS